MAAETRTGQDEREALIATLQQEMADPNTSDEDIFWDVCMTTGLERELERQRAGETLDEFVDMSPATFRRRMAMLGYKVHKHGDKWTLVNTETGRQVLTDVTQEKAVNWAADRFFGFSPD